MKYLLALFVAMSAQGAVISRNISTPDATSEQRFEIEKGKATYFKSSNFFDLKKELAVGTFAPKKPIPEKDLARLEEILEKIKTVDEFLKKKNSAFNELSEKKPHESYIRLDQYRITQGSELYPELKDIFERLQTYEWKQESGIRLTDDYKNLITVKNGKDVSKESFHSDFYCNKQAVPPVCLYKNIGVIYLEKK